jgi:hypothetical protein
LAGYPWSLFYKKGVYIDTMQPLISGIIHGTRAALKEMVRAREWLAGVLADKDDGKEQVWHMLSYFLRELAVLIIVFYPFDVRVQFTKTEIFSVAILCLIVGIIMERKRGKRRT